MIEDVGNICTHSGALQKHVHKKILNNHIESHQRRSANITIFVILQQIFLMVLFGHF